MGSASNQTQADFGVSVPRGKKKGEQCHRVSARPQDPVAGKWAAVLSWAGFPICHQYSEAIRRLGSSTSWNASCTTCYQPFP